MSLVFEKVEDSIGEKSADWSIGRPSFRVTMDPSTTSQLNLPRDYKYHSVFLQRKYPSWSEKFNNFKVRDSDIWICGIGKTGTTWIHNIAWQLRNNLDFNVPAKKSNDEFFEAPITLDKVDGNKELNAMVDEVEYRFSQYDHLPSTRIFKSHFPAFLLPHDVWTVKNKIIYITRDPKDAVVSLYYMLRNNIASYTGTLDELCECYMSGFLVYAPFYDHLFSYWQLRHLDHVLIMTYEELSADQFGGVKRINDFLGCTYSDEQLTNLVDHVSFANMRKMSLDNTSNLDGGKRDQDYRHCRKGKVGGYRDDLSPEMIKRFDYWTEQHLKGSDFEFFK